MTYEEFAKATPEEKKAFRKKMQENSISINDLKATLKVLEQYGKNFGMDSRIFENVKSGL